MSSLKSFVIHNPIIDEPWKPRSIKASEYDSKNHYLKPRIVRFQGILDEQLALVEAGVVDEDVLQEHLKDLDYLADRGLLMRVNRWLTFLNEPFFCWRETYSHLVYSVLIAAKENAIFRSQSSHEFQISLDFLGRVLKRKPRLNLTKLESAEYLLRTCLIVSKYPGMVIRSFHQAIDHIDENGSNESLQALFAYLFVKYENPAYLINHLTRLQPTEIELLMFVLQGNSIRKFHSLPMPISRKESWVLQHEFPAIVQFDEDVLLRQIVCSKLLISAKGNAEVLEGFVENCKRFQFDLQTFIKDLAFWKRAFDLCCKIEWDAVAMTLTDFLDHIDYRRYVDEEDFSLKGRTALSLQQESQNLKHCALSYIQHCADGHTSVWSLKRKEDGQFKSFITVEIRGGNVTQARGLCNRNLTEEEEALLQLVLEKYDSPDEDGFDGVVGGSMV